MGGGPMILVWVPLKVLYFLGGPFPWSDRSVTDVYGSLHGVLFLAMTWYLLRQVRRRYHPLDAKLLFALAVVIFVYAMGSSNYGTAIRHREKFLGIFCLLVFIGQPATVAGEPVRARER
jgi:predicted membrane channel-forming protein YqfA (hemolysin III family)